MKVPASSTTTEIMHLGLHSVKKAMFRTAKSDSSMEDKHGIFEQNDCRSASGTARNVKESNVPV